MAAYGSRDLVFCCSDVQVRCRRVGGCSLHRDVVERHVLGRYGPPVMWVGVWLLRMIAARKAWWKLGLSMTATTWSTPPREGIFHGNLGYLLHLRGEVDPAILHLQEGIGICDQAWPLAGMMFRGSLAIVVATQGDFKEAYALLDAADRHFKEDHPFERAQLLCQKVEVMHLAGEKVTAERTWQEAAHIVKGLAVSDDSELAESLASARALLDAKA